MLRKFLICCSPIVVLAMLAMPAFATVTVTYPAITHSWPDFGDGTTAVINTMKDGGANAVYSGDPNALLCTDGGVTPPPYQKVPENFSDRMVGETFTVPLDLNTPAATPYGLTLKHIVITAGGNGADANQPMSLHIYDMNQAAPFPCTATTGNYILVGNNPAGGGNNANDSMIIPPGDYLTNPSTFIFRRDTGTNIPDIFVAFHFSGFDSFDLEPNHVYAFEIWPTKGDNPGWNWYRGTAALLGGGLCYRVDPPADYRLLSTQRQAVATGTRTAVLGVYGVPCDNNAFHPVPRNLEPAALLGISLTWHPGRNVAAANGHYLYLGTDNFLVGMRDPSVQIGPLTNATYTPTLQPDTYYYWRVDEVNGANTWGFPDGETSDCYWTFKTSGPQATAPSPPNNSQNTEFKPTNAWLSWTMGCYNHSTDVNGHQVYFSTSFADVNTANTSTALVYRGAVSDPCYPLKKLAGAYTLNSGTTYYWRIDEVNGVNTYKGTIWSFQMPNPAYILLDSFSYISPDALAAIWKWSYKLPFGVPGEDYNDNGCTGVTVAGNVMNLGYDNSYATNGPWSEAKLDYNTVSTTGVDWTFGGAFVPKAIGVQFDGNLGNTLNSTDNAYDRLYMGLEDAHGRLGVAYYDADIYAAQRAITIAAGNAATREWKVKLSDLTSPNNVDLNEVNRVYLGIGSPRGGFHNYTAGGKGMLHFANLRVYVQHCNPDMNNVSKVAGDLTGALVGAFSGDHTRYSRIDCITNLNDIAYFADDWLFNEPNLDFHDTNTDPGPTDLQCWYKFDEGSGTAITDYSGKSPARNATLYNSGPFTWSYAGHNGGGSVNLEPGYHTYIQCPNQVVANVGGQTGQTFTFWLKYNDRFFEEHYWASVLVFFRDAPGGANSQTIETQLPDPFTPGQAAMPWLRWVDMRISKETGLQKNRASMVSSRWNHYALVYDTTAQRMSIWVNATRISTNNDVTMTRVWGPNDTGDGNANSVRIGTRSNSATPSATNQFWQGRIDDMRLYSKALIASEIQYLATDGTGRRDMQAVFGEPDDYKNTTVTLLSGQTVKIINFNDFATLAGYWLNQQMSF